MRQENILRHATNRILGLVDRPRRVAYVPWYLAFSHLLEAGFGWLIDRLGPLLLRRDSTSSVR